MRRSFESSIFGLCLLVWGIWAAPAALAERYDLPVDVELVLAVDVSGSMDHEEHTVQRQGYVQALGHPDFVRAVRSGGFQRVALTYVEWAGAGRQAIVLPWTAVADEEDGQRISSHLAAAPISFMRGTSISSMLDFALPLFEGNGFEGVRRVVDVSGDGPNNMGPPVVPSRDRLLEAGVTINGLPIMIRPSMRAGPTSPGLDDYYRECVIGGPGAFVLPVDDLHHMAEAIRQKLILDIAGLPGDGVAPARAGLPDDGIPGVVPVQAGLPVDCMIGERQRRGFWLEP
jgi:hypothetical protein